MIWAVAFEVWELVKPGLVLYRAILLFSPVWRAIHALLILVEFWVGVA
jgi:hypothetical protein